MSELLELWTRRGGIARPTLVGEPPANERFKPWLSFGPSGQLAIVWRTNHSDKSYDVWAAIGQADGPNGVEDWYGRIPLTTFKAGNG